MRAGIARQAIEIRAVTARRSLELSSAPAASKASAYSSMPACAEKMPAQPQARFLGAARVRRAVGAEEEARAAAGHGAQQRRAIGFRLEHRQAVVMRAHAAREQRVAVHQQVLRGDGGGDAGAARLTRTRTAARVVMCSNTMRRLGWRSRERRQHLIDEARLAIEHIHLGSVTSPCTCSTIDSSAMRSSTASSVAHVRDAGVRVGGGAGRIEFAAVDRSRWPWRARSPPARSRR